MNFVALANSVNFPANLLNPEFLNQFLNVSYCSIVQLFSSVLSEASVANCGK